MSLLTKRIPTLMAILLLLGLAIGGAYYYWQNRPVASEEAKPIEVRITNIADNKFTVSWTTKSRMTGEIEWGEVGAKLANRARDDRDTGETSGEYLTHHITLAGLQPNTAYAFRILSGKGNRFDNNGSPYSVSTGPVITTTPIADSFYGQVESSGGKPPLEAIAYIAIPGGAPLSTLIKSGGGYSVSLSTARTEDLTEYVAYDPAATVVSVTVVDGIKDGGAMVSLANAAPVPTIMMGEQQDFRTSAATIAQVEPQPQEGTESAEEQTSETPTTPTIFNVEPLGEVPEPTGEVILLNPLEEGEDVATVRPEFFGVGAPETVLSITVHSTTPYSDTVVVDDNGDWVWSPPADLEPGEHTITIAYIDAQGLEQVLTRNFFVGAALAAEPAFEATPSGSTSSPTPTPKPSVTPAPSSSSQYETSPTPAPSVRESMPSTEGGVPVTGIASPTVLTGLIGFAIMVVGALLLAL